MLVMSSSELLASEMSSGPPGMGRDAQQLGLSADRQSLLDCLKSHLRSYQRDARVGTHLAGLVAVYVRIDNSDRAPRREYAPIVPPEGWWTRNDHRGQPKRCCHVAWPRIHPEKAVTHRQECNELLEG